ncbi:MAG: hypothetical protein V4719_20705 [Planctomycetota bacterium]
MKLTMTLLRRPAAVAGLLLAMSAPATVFSADQYGNQARPMAQAMPRVQPVNYNCPNGDCNNGGGQAWGGNYGGGCPNGHCFGGGGLFGHGCRHGSASGYAWVRPPATWGLSRTPNTYRYYWNTQLAGIPSQGGQQFPMVYQPTDTTQMGFYYQSVPRWQYRPEMLPPAPTPNWPLGMNSAYGGGYGGTYGAGYGGGYGSGAPVSSPTYAPTNAQPIPATQAAPTEPQAPR